MPRTSDLAPKIDAYLQKRGSPMAGQGMAFLRAGRKFGIDPRLLVGIATIESGAGAHMKLAYNPFNWGVHRGQTFDSWQDAIMQVARGLKRNYVDQGLTTPQQIVNKYAPSSDGNDTGNWSKVVNQVMGQLGGPVSMGSVPGVPAPAAAPGMAAPAMLTPPPAAPEQVFDPGLMGKLINRQIIEGGGRMDLMKLPGTLDMSFRTVPPPAAATSPPGLATIPNTGAGPVQPSLPTTPGKGITLPWEYKSTHETDGLQDEGFTRAIDIIRPPGTPVSAPSAGTVIYFHPTGAQGGGSMLIRFANGREGWIGHIANGLPAGTKFKGGQQLAVVSSDHATPHAHWSLR